MYLARHKIHQFLRRMTLREKLLSLLFLLVMLILWTGSLLNRTSTWNTNRQHDQATLAIQQHWLEREDHFALKLAQALQRVDPEKTYAATQLSERIDSILRQVALSSAADIDPVRTRTGEIFNDHTIHIRLRRISIAQLIQLNQLLSQETPYLNRQSVRITKNRRKPEELDVRFEMNSFDLKNP